MELEDQQTGLVPSCRLCKHYRVSWDPAAPHGCTALGFKSSQMPSVVVYETSGIECQLFALKPQPPKAN
jgi:hypothetical protein